MKKLILSTVALAALTFASCKKDNLQPTTNNSTNIEQTSLETAEQESNDDKVVDARNKFVGTWKGKASGGAVYTIKISKASSNRLFVSYKVGTTTGSTFSQYTGYAKLISSLKFAGTTTPHGFKLEGTKTSSTSKKLKFIDAKGTPDQVTVNTTKQ